MQFLRFSVRLGLTLKQSPKLHFFILFAKFKSAILLGGFSGSSGLNFEKIAKIAFFILFPKKTYNDSLHDAGAKSKFFVNRIQKCNFDSFMQIDFF